jgi:sugar-phosphatase
MPRRILSSDHPEWSLEVAGVLIDMDGTLVDSTAAITRQWWTFLDWYGLPPTAFPHPLHGKRAEDHVRALVPPELVDEALQRFLRQELADVEGITAVPGAQELVEQLGAAALPWGLVTSGTLPVVRLRLAAAGIAAPAVMVTAEDVVHGKPDPEPYLIGRRLLGVPGPLLALEDAPPGIDSAAGAGCQVVAVSTTHPTDQLTGADLILPDLTSLRILS